MKKFFAVLAIGAALATLDQPAAAAGAQSLAETPAVSREGDGHDHKAEPKQATRDLGSKEINGYTVKVEQESDVKAGKEGAFAITLTGGKGKPKAIRAWVGISSAEGSVKTKAVPEEEKWHAHVEVPDPLAGKSQFWVEIETDAGKHKVAFDYK